VRGVPPVHDQAIERPKGSSKINLKEGTVVGVAVAIVVVVVFGMVVVVVSPVGVVVVSPFGESVVTLAVVFIVVVVGSLAVGVSSMVSA